MTKEEIEVIENQLIGEKKILITNLIDNYGICSSYDDYNRAKDEIRERLHKFLLELINE